MMKSIPETYREPCERRGTVERIAYGDKAMLVYIPIRPAQRILYLIHGGGGNETTFFRPACLNLLDHMTAEGVMEPMYVVTPCFYPAAQEDRTPAASGVAVKAFMGELREKVVPLSEERIGRRFSREERAIGGFSMGSVTTWYAFMQCLDLFSAFLPLSGDCWAMGEKGGGTFPEATASRLAEAWKAQGSLPFRMHAVTGSKDIAYPNLDPQIRAMQAIPGVFGDSLRYDVLEGGVHDYETIFRYLYHALPDLMA